MKLVPLTFICAAVAPTFPDAASILGEFYINSAVIMGQKETFAAKITEKLKRKTHGLDFIECLRNIPPNPDGKLINYTLNYNYELHHLLKTTYKEHLEI